jgi:hypothetical protein
MKTALSRTIYCVSAAAHFVETSRGLTEKSWPGSRPGGLPQTIHNRKEARPGF